MILVDGQIVWNPIAPDPVDGSAAGDHDFSDTRTLGGVQQIPTALDIGSEVNRVGEVVAVVDARQMHDGIVTGDRGVDRLEIENVGLTVGHVPGRRLDIEHRDGAAIAQRVDHEATQQAAASGDHDFIEFHDRFADQSFPACMAESRLSS